MANAAVTQARRCAMAAAAVGAVLLSSACSPWRTPTVPMASTIARAPCAQRPTTLLVLLPGAASDRQEFIDNGYVAAVRERGIAADVLLADAHLGYYRDRSVLDRLQADIVEPARQQGYRDIWLVGISVGGLGALGFAESQPQALRGVVAIAPFLGEPPVLAEIRAAGGLRRWPAPAGPLPADDYARRLWRWLQAQTAAGDGGAESAGRRPVLYLAYGRDDRLHEGHELLAAALPAGQVFSVAGGHDWDAWRPLWRRLLAALPLPVDASCTGAAVPR